MQQKSSRCIKGVGGAPHCPVCKGYSIKYGFSKANKQRYKCKTCAKVYIIKYAYKAYLKYIDKAIIKLLQECCGIRSISRVLEIATSTVLSRIKTIASTKKPPTLSYHQSYEVDELCTFVKSKNKRIWIVYAWCRESRKVVNYTLFINEMGIPNTFNIVDQANNQINTTISQNNSVSTVTFSVPANSSFTINFNRGPVMGNATDNISLEGSYVITE